MTALFTKNKFRDDVFDFFDYTRGGHLDREVYYNPDRWVRIVRSFVDGNGKYYLADPRREKSVLSEISSAHNSFINNGQSVTSIFEIGAGTGDKILPFISNPNLKSVTLIDYEVGLNEAAHDRIRSVNPDIPITLLEQDFEESGSTTKISGRVLGMILGGTIANISCLPDLQSMEAQDSGDCSFLKGALKRRFENASKFYFDSGDLLVTIDIGSKKDSFSAYQGDEHADFVMGALELIPDFLETSLTKDQIRGLFRHEPVIVEPFGKTRAICHTLCCDNGASFTIEGRRFNLKAGFRNSVINSFKPTEQQLIESAELAGFRHIKTYSDPDSLIAVVHLKYEKSKLGRVIGSNSVFHQQPSLGVAANFS